jgi:hypothetical protein
VTDAEKIKMLLDLSHEKDGDAAANYLALAKSRIMERRYPYGVKDGTEMPTRYDELQVQLANTMWAKEGAEGESTHYEGTVKRVYEDDDALLSQVLPYIGFREVSS